MDRYAVFVDVGYVLASVAELVAGSPERHRVRCDFGKLVDALRTEISSRTSLPLLRAYWYDASITGQPEHDQTTIADLQGVRLRLGRLVRGEQKGVDSRIVRDLIVLARDEAIAEAYVLAGDEDLCEGIEEAQDQGVRVTLIGVPGLNQSRLLIQQADEQYVLADSFWRTHFAAADTQLTDAPVRVATAPSTDAPLYAPKTSPGATAGYPAVRAAFEAAVARSGESSAVAGLAAEVHAFERAARQAGIAFAKVLKSELAPFELDDMRRNTSLQIPREFDVRLLRYADDSLTGKLWERPELKPIVRRGFWDEIRTAP